MTGIHPSAIVESEDIGPGTRIWAFVHICRDSHIGKECNIGDHCSVESGVFVGDCVTVKNGALLWEGVTICVGAHAMVGAGAVVTRDVPPHAVVSGNPARVRSWVCSCGHQLVGTGVAAECRQCGRTYRVTRSARGTIEGAEECR